MTKSIERQRRIIVASAAVLLIGGAAIFGELHQITPPPDNNSTVEGSHAPATGSAEAALAKLAIKGRAPMTGYSREQFGGDWASEGSCTMRDKILSRDMTAVTFKGATCEVATGTLNDPYTGHTIHFVRGVGTSEAVQIDHVVALGDAWQTGAQQLTKTKREQLYNDPLELLAVNGPTNDNKGDGDAATWLPPNKSYRCRYVARQIAVKATYNLWVTPAEHDAMQTVLNSCPDQALPVVGSQ